MFDMEALKQWKITRSTPAWEALPYPGPLLPAGWYQKERKLSVDSWTKYKAYIKEIAPYRIAPSSVPDDLWEGTNGTAYLAKAVSDRNGTPPIELLEEVYDALTGLPVSDSISSMLDDILSRVYVPTVDATALASHMPFWDILCTSGVVRCILSGNHDHTPVTRIEELPAYKTLQPYCLGEVKAYLNRLGLYAGMRTRQSYVTIRQQLSLLVLTAYVVPSILDSSPEYIVSHFGFHWGPWLDYRWLLYKDTSLAERARELLTTLTALNIEDKYSSPLQHGLVAFIKTLTYLGHPLPLWASLNFEQILRS